MGLAAQKLLKKKKVQILAPHQETFVLLARHISCINPREDRIVSVVAWLQFQTSCLSLSSLFSSFLIVALCLFKIVASLQRGFQLRIGFIVMAGFTNQGYSGPFSCSPKCSAFSSWIKFLMWKGLESCSFRYEGPFLRKDRVSKSGPVVFAALRIIGF